MVKVKIAAFRPENLIAQSREEAAKYSFEFFGFPLFQLVERRDAVEELKLAFMDTVDIVVFTSLNGVQKSFSLAEHGNFNLKEKLATTEVCAIGPVTREELHRHGVHVSLMPGEYSAKGLMKLLAAHIEAEAGAEAEAATRTKILFLRSAAGNKRIIEFLQDRGADVMDIAVYEPRPIADETERMHFEELIHYQPDYIIFTSSLTFKMFIELASRFGMRGEITSLLRSANIAAIGDLTAGTILEAGIGIHPERVMVAERSTFADILSAIATAAGLDIEIDFNIKR